MSLKKILPRAVLAALALPGCFHPAFAAGGTGTSAFQFLQLGVGARPSGMGETFAGAANDVNAIYWNPAGLAGMERGELSMTHALWLEDITYSNIAYGRPALGGTFGVAFNILNAGDIRKADNTGLRLAEKYSMADTMGIVSYARGWGAFALGANLKHISSRLEEESARSYAADVGARYGGLLLSGRKLGVGVSVQNLGGKAGYVSEKNPLPVLVRAGVSLELFKSLLVASDLNYTEKDTSVHAGAEYTCKFGAFALAARAGYKDDTVRKLGALSGLTAGMGFKWGDYQLDYAWNSFTDLGITHRISFGIKFSGPDADGVADHSGKHPASANGPVVDTTGRSLDKDADGVPDDLDKCPGTSTAAPVDAAGCLPDSDKDGVPDPLDKCPDTTPAAAVDAAGCPAGPPAEALALYRLTQLASPGSVTLPVVTAVHDVAGDPACPWEQVDKLCLKLAVGFEDGKAGLKGDFTARLKEIAAFMAANPGARMELQGYTDDHGDDDSNRGLSKDRADSVMKHLVEAEGLAAGRLSASGMGKARPVASNQEKAGRQRNRRVIAVLTMER